MSDLRLSAIFKADLRDSTPLFKGLAEDQRLHGVALEQLPEALAKRLQAENIEVYELER
jgi:hypothetical protein